MVKNAFFCIKLGEWYSCKKPSLLRRLDNGVGYSITQSISLDAASFISWVLQYTITSLYKDAFDKCRQSICA